MVEDHACSVVDLSRYTGHCLGTSHAVATYDASNTLTSAITLATATARTSPLSLVNPQ